MEVSLNVIGTITRPTGDYLDTAMVMIGQSAATAAADEISTSVKIRVALGSVGTGISGKGEVNEL